LQNEGIVCKPLPAGVHLRFRQGLHPPKWFNHFATYKFQR